MPRVLVVDDQADIRQVLAEVLGEEGFEVSTAEDGEAALDEVAAHPPHVVLCDLKMPHLDGIQTLERMRGLVPDVPVIVMTAYGDIPTAVKAMKLGAHDFLAKPFHNDDLLSRVKQAVARHELRSDAADLRSQLTTASALREIMGSSPKVQEVFRQIQHVAGTNFTVIIEGETGTGKEIVARAIHQQSGRSGGPFIALDCGAIPEPLIESELFGHEKGAFTGADRRREGYVRIAAGGTLFLDEIANLPLTTQGKLLRALQERQIQPLGAKKLVPVDLRIIVASNVRLEGEVKAGRFRDDLFHRLDEFTIRIPPLRERREDVIHLAQRFLDEANADLGKRVRGFTEEGIASLMECPWPGNARELRNVVRRAALLSQDLIGSEHLSDMSSSGEAAPPLARWESDLRNGLSLKEISLKTTAHVEKEVIQGVLRVTGGNKSQAARLLRIDYKTLHYKLKEYGIRTRELMP